MENDSFIREVLGDAFTERYVKEKEQEWNRYANQVTQWEIEEYLYRI